RLNDLNLLPVQGISNFNHRRQLLIPAHIDATLLVFSSSKEHDCIITYRDTVQGRKMGKIAFAANHRCMSIGYYAQFSIGIIVYSSLTILPKSDKGYVPFIHSFLNAEIRQCPLASWDHRISISDY